MMPCYNGARTLPLALASLVSQTHAGWECVLVDDGSTDHPERVVESIGDERIKLVRLERNMGRGVARQVALERAQGEFLAFLDADDWIYPDKLAWQVAALEAHPDLCAVSMSLAVVDFLGHPVGVRRIAPRGAGLIVGGPMLAPEPPPAAFASTMIRMEVAQEARFDPALRLSQDTDFMLQVLLGRKFGMTDETGYVYTELASRTPKKNMAGYRFTQQIYRKYLREHPWASRKQIAIYGAKFQVMRLFDRVGMGAALVSAQLPAPDFHDMDAFWRAHRRVDPLRRRFEAAQRSL